MKHSLTLRVDGKLVFKAILKAAQEAKDRALMKYWHTQSTAPMTVTVGMTVFIKSEAEHNKFGKLQAN